VEEIVVVKSDKDAECALTTYIVALRIPAEKTLSSAQNITKAHYQYQEQKI